MKINLECPLVLKDLYFYDIKSCFPQLLESINYSIETDLKDKEKRNIEIGKQQIDNKNLSSFLQSSTENLVSFYLTENNILDEDIIVLQKDGFIIKKMLHVNDTFIKMDFRKFIDFMIISHDRKKFLYGSENSIIFKGVVNSYPELNLVYNKFLHLDFYYKSRLFSQLQGIKDYVFNSINKKLFMIDSSNGYIIYTKKFGQLKIANDSLFKIEDIDKKKYYNHYFRPFIDSIFLEFY
tara:strand:- start:1466 stop:2176 length:711 start_codon:yes stop_codon:yes gene_type:complete